jgi:enamine deaminase RidA (YjgF/YER057c/UK114 family)
MSLPQYVVTDRNGAKTVSTGSAWEPKMGYSRAVRKGQMIAVTGTVGIEADKTFTPDVGAQAQRALAIIQGAIESLGGKISDVIRTRMYVTRIADWEKVAAVHGAVFRDIRPATTIVEVAKLIDDAALIEIEADAIVG